MCTRFYIRRDEREIKEIIERIQGTLLFQRFIEAGKEIMTCGEIRPTNVVPVIATNREGKRTAFPMQWGFPLPGRSPLINARSETAAEKTTFKEAWAKHRCIIPASWYFEWEHLRDDNGKKTTGAKLMIRPKDSGLTWLCGLYRMENGLPVFTVLTREPSEELRRIHDRMPLILPKEKIGYWIDPDSNPRELLQYSLTDMIFEEAAL